MRAAIQEATFVAIDTEFTGLYAEGGGEDPLDDYDERYKRVLTSADNFAICQFGLSAFKWHAAPASSPSRGGGYWEAKTFNAYIFPRSDDRMGWDKRFLCQASSLTYLAEQGFDFNKMIHDGIGFVPLQVRDAKVRGLREELDKTQRARELRTPAEEEMAEAARARVLSWLLGGEPELLLPMPPTRRLRTLLRLLLQDEFQLPSLGYDPFAIDFLLSPDGGNGGTDGEAGGSAAAAVVAAEGAAAIGGDGNGVAEEERGGGAEGGGSDGEGSDSDAGAAGPQFMRLRRLDHWRPGNLIASGQHLTPRQRIEMMVEQCGFSQVLDILRDAGRPLVGHNATFDMAYTLSHFNGSLPRTWRDYKAVFQRVFPGGLYDTKHIAAQLAAAGVPVGETGLGALYRTLTDEAWLRANVPGAGLPPSLGGGVPEVRHAPGFDGYVGVSTEKAHEAGFDAFMTGAAFTRLLRLVGAKAALQSGGGAAVEAAAADTAAAVADEAADSALLQPLAPYRGRVHFTRSDLPYADMYGSDPLPSRPAVVHVSGFGPQTRPPFLLQRFTALGYPPAQVTMLTAPSGAAIGAFVQLARPDVVPRAMQAVRKKYSNWNVSTFAEYYQYRQQQQQQQEAGTSSGAGAGRAAPRFIRTPAAGAAMTVQQQPQQQQRSGDGSGGQAATVEGGSSAAARTQWRKDGGSGGGGASQPAAEAAGGSSAGLELAEGQAQPQPESSGVVSERQRLQAFTQKVAAVAASTSGNLQSRSSPQGSEVAAPDVQVESRGQEDAAREAPSSGNAAATVSGADEASRPSAEMAAPTASGSAAGGEPSGAMVDGAGSAADAEAAKQAAERLRSLALAAQRLKSWPARREPSGGAAEGGGGLALQRPGRPSR